VLYQIARWNLKHTKSWSRRDKESKRISTDLS